MWEAGRAICLDSIPAMRRKYRCIVVSESARRSVYLAPLLSKEASKPERISGSSDRWNPQSLKSISFCSFTPRLNKRHASISSRTPSNEFAIAIAIVMAPFHPIFLFIRIHSNKQSTLNPRSSSSPPSPYHPARSAPPSFRTRSSAESAPLPSRSPPA